MKKRNNVMQPAVHGSITKMKITKRQLRRIIKEEIQGYDTQEFMQKITDFDNEFQNMWVGAPFRSAGVRMAMEKMREALYELGTGMREELKTLETLGD
jgi:hypothetical protein